jgi:Planctomycete cytochrome C
MKFLIIILIMLTTIILFYRCDDTINAYDIDNRIIPDSNVSYSKDLAPVFELKCVSCHGPTKTDGGVDLSTWSGVTNTYLLTPGPNGSASSLLVFTVERRPGFSAMPPLDSPYFPFTSNQIRGLKTWIDEDAKNN